MRHLASLEVSIARQIGIKKPAVATCEQLADKVQEPESNTVSLGPLLPPTVHSGP